MQGRLILIDNDTDELFEAACDAVRRRPGREGASSAECLRLILDCYVTELTQNDPETGTE